MKNAMLLGISVFLLLFPLSQTQGQEGESPDLIWETIMLSPDHTKLKTLGDNLRAHNQKYHNSGKHQASVYNITTGPNSGKLVWIMGPFQWEDLDSRPAEEGHDEDWRDKVMPHLTAIEQIEYWRQQNELSNTDMLPEDPSSYPILFTRYHEIEKGQGHNWRNMLEMVSKTIKAMPGDNPWGVYINEFRQGNIGRHIASVGFFKDWKDFAQENQFRDKFDEVHGNNQWDRFVRNMDNTFENSWDEIWEYNKHLSGK